MPYITLQQEMSLNVHQVRNDQEPVERYLVKAVVLKPFFTPVSQEATLQSSVEEITNWAILRPLQSSSRIQNNDCAALKLRTTRCLWTLPSNSVPFLPSELCSQAQYQPHPHPLISCFNVPADCIYRCMKQGLGYASHRLTEWWDRPSNHLLLLLSYVRKLQSSGSIVIKLMLFHSNEELNIENNVLTDLKFILQFPVSNNWWQTMTCCKYHQVHARIPGVGHISKCYFSLRFQKLELLLEHLYPSYLYLFLHCI